MGKPAARIGDMHTCPMVTPGTPPIPHVGGPIIPPCAITVLTVGIPQARITDMCVCVGPPDSIAMGSPTVLVNNLMAARMGDPTTHGGVIVVGAPTVLIGESGGGGGGGGGGGMGMGAGESQFRDFEFTPWQTTAAESSQAKVLKQAANDGTPFCETCNS